MPFPILFGTTVTTVLHYRADCDSQLSPMKQCDHSSMSYKVFKMSSVRLHTRTQTSSPLHVIKISLMFERYFEYYAIILKGAVFCEHSVHSLSFNRLNSILSTTFRPT